MAYFNYGDNRWKICCGFNLSPVEQKAVNEIYGFMQQYLPYVFTVCETEADITENDHIVYIGTLESNPALVKLANAGAFEVETRKEGYSIKVMPSANRAEHTDIISQGADASGVLYGVYELEHAYFDNLLKYEGYHFDKRVKPLIDPCTNFEEKSAPSLVNRGLWTWGHKIYDYKGYLDNMARCRMNMLIMWNDSVPLNAKDIIDYAHSCGIKIVWGYTCAWGGEIKVDPNDPASAEYWGKRVLEVYEREYLPLGGDGVYFQAFTEHTHLEMDGVPTATLITNWINHMEKVLHDAYPDLYVQFGIHASSIRENSKLMGHLTSGVTPVWEDCGGLPYHYDPRRGDMDYAAQFTKDIVELAKPKGNFGVVLKGFHVLNWKEFEHFKGRVLVGVADKIHMRRRLEETQFYWKFQEPYWINHLDRLQAFCQTVAAANFVDSTATALVEDGLFDLEIAPAVGLFAELLWDANADLNKVREKIYHSVHFGH